MTPDLITDNQSEWHRRIGPCPGCSKRLDYTDEECAEFIATDDRLRQNAPSLSRRLNAMKVYCDRCAIRLADENNANDKREKAVHNHIHAFASGLLPDEMRDISFDKSDPAKEAQNKDVWRRLRKGVTENLWICGDHGTGKTHLARCMIKRELREGYTVAELKWSQFIQIAKEYHAEKLLERYAHVRWLMIDDIDKITANERNLTTLFGLLDKRQERKGRLIMTSNVKSKALRDQWSAVMSLAGNTTYVPALWERLYPYQTIEMVGTSLRRAGA
jgi:DNA replication protein DnaC